MLWLIVEILSGLINSLLSLQVLLSVENVDAFGQVVAIYLNTAEGVGAVVASGGIVLLYSVDA